MERIEHRISLGAESRIIRVEAADIITDISGYKKVLRSHAVHLSNFYLSYDYRDNTTRLNLVILARENIKFIPLFNDLRTVYPTNSISLANQVSI